ncbi:hypothetical protein [uncultured Nocardioides sp.]|uniref:hypothetical protein n=1 Tax=uncultured Nocardioides sp. TaxID=198441 RepID=UPI002622AA7F|nr:hypothetical protein [uncultured Nocardioides sp.]
MDRPTDGIDPGLDWPGPKAGRRAVQNTCFRILTAVEQGTFGFNKPLEFDLPNGTTVLTVREPETAGAVQATALAPHTPVAQVGWELRRNDFGPPLPVSAAELPGLIRKCREVAEKVPFDAAVPHDLAIDAESLGEDSFPVSDTYGPASPLVRAVAASLATAAEPVVGGLVYNAYLLRDVGESQHRFDSRLSTVARAAGRSSAVSRCEELAKTLPIATQGDQDAERLEMAVRVTLKTAALHDRLDDADRMRGYGPWETSLYFPERPPGQAATDETIALVEAALAALSPAVLAELVDRHGDESAFEDLDIHAVTHRTGLPPQHPLLEVCADRSVRHVEAVRPLLTTLLSAAAWRHEDGEDDDTPSAYTGWGLVDEYGDLMPNLTLLLRLGPRPEDF